MKRIIAILLLVCFCSTLCACQKKIDLDDAKSAPQLDIDEWERELEENVAKATQQYDKKLFRVTGTVIEIDKYSCTIGHFKKPGEFADDKQLTVYLDEDVLASLVKGQVYTFAGTFQANSNDWTIPLLSPAILIDSCN